MSLSDLSVPNESTSVFNSSLSEPTPGFTSCPAYLLYILSVNLSISPTGLDLVLSSYPNLGLFSRGTGSSSLSVTFLVDCASPWPTIKPFSTLRKPNGSIFYLTDESSRVLLWVMVSGKAFLISCMIYSSSAYLSSSCKALSRSSEFIWLKLLLRK